jgi:hypothetical protein
MHLRAHPPVQLARSAVAAELYTLDAVQSAEQSFAAPEAAAGREQRVQLAAAEPAALPMQ